MFGLMVRKIPKEVKVPKWVQRSDYWNTKTWSIELGTVDIGQWVIVVYIIYLKTIALVPKGKIMKSIFTLKNQKIF